MLEAKNFVALAPDNETRVLFHFLCMKDSFFIYISTIRDVGALADLHVGMPPLARYEQRRSNSSSTTKEEAEDKELAATVSKLRLTTVAEEQEEEGDADALSDRIKSATPCPTATTTTSTSSSTCALSSISSRQVEKVAQHYSSLDALPQPSSCLLGCIDSLGSSLASQLAQFFGMPMHVSCNVSGPQLTPQGEEYAKFYLFLLSNCRDFVKAKLLTSSNNSVEGDEAVAHVNKRDLQAEEAEKVQDDEVVEAEKVLECGSTTTLGGEKVDDEAGTTTALEGCEKVLVDSAEKLHAEAAGA